ncbi:MAG: DUF3306 domain-containing protein [Woeseiaceae bacterium]
MTLKKDTAEVKSGFMQRWSERKIESKNEIENKKTESELITTAQTESTKDAQDEEQQVEEYKTDADMPPIDELTEDSNFSDFLSPKVSEVLRKQALRKLFHMPFLNVVDGLDDYAEDYTKFASLGDIIPHDMKRMLDREKAKELKEKEEEEMRDAENLKAEEQAKEEEKTKTEAQNNDLDNDTDFDNEGNAEELLLSENDENNESINLNKDKIENEKLN